MKKHQYKNPYADMDGFVSSLQKEDQRNTILTRNFQWIMWVLALLYAAIFLFIPDNTLTILNRIGGLCFSLAFILFAFIFRKFYKEYRSVDYGVPVLEMLKQAARRYKMFQRKLLLVLPPVLFVDAAMVLLRYEENSSKTIAEQILFVQYLIIPAFMIGLIIGLIIARKRQKPLRDAALALIKEIES